MSSYRKVVNEFTYQLCNNKADIDAVGKLRYQCYLSVDAIAENKEKIFLDKYDALPNCKSVMIYEQDRILSSVRACIYNPEMGYTQIPSLEAYKDEISYHLGLDKVIVDSNRFVIDSDKMDSKTFFKIPFRFMALNVLKYDCDYIITAVRKKHAPLYTRFLTFEVISEARKFPGIDVEMVLMAGDVRKNLGVVLDKEELFNISEEEVAQYPI